MPRRTFDKLVSSVGVLLTVGLLIAGGLMFWGYTFANNNVHTQLAAQHITMPAGQALPEAAADKAALQPYAGQQLTNGAQAQAYANHYIAVHLKEVAGGKTYSEVSTLARANPSDTTLAGQVQTLFRGETLRGLLLEAYGFWKFGQLAFIGSIASFAIAGLMAIFVVLGFRHVRKVAPEAEIFSVRKTA